MYSSRDTFGKESLKELINLADLTKVEKAINKNDADLAYSIYDKAIKPVLKTTNVNIGLGPLSEAGIGVYDEFEFMLKKPLKEWFPTDPIQHWVKGENRKYGWESHAKYVIRGARTGVATKVPTPAPVTVAPAATTHGFYYPTTGNDSNS